MVSAGEQTPDRGEETGPAPAPGEREQARRAYVVTADADRRRRGGARGRTAAGDGAGAARGDGSVPPAAGAEALDWHGTAAADGDDGEGEAGAGPASIPAAGAGTLTIRLAPAALDRPAPRRRPRHASIRRRETWAVRAVVVAAALGGALTEASPSGSGVADRVLTAGFVALLAAAGSSAKRWTWFVAAGAGLALAEGRVALVCGLVALGLALVSTGPVRPHPAVGAAVGALSGLALLRATGPDVQGGSALVAAAAVLPLVVSGHRHAGHASRRRTRRVLAGAALAVGAVCGAYAVAASSARPPAERGLERLQQGMDAARAGDDDLATRRLAEAADAFEEADRHLGSWYAAPARALPVIGDNARATATMASAAASVARDGTHAALEADIDGLTVQDGRLDLDRVRALAGPLDDVATVLHAADADLAALDDGWLLPPVAERLDRIRADVASARPDVDLAADATRVVPAIFGGDGDRRWLVAFVTPVEARGRTGFFGNFAELTAVDGDVEMTRFGRASELEDGGTPGPARTLSGPDDYLDRWARFSPAAVWRNVTMSPDFPSVGQVVTELYPQSGGQPVDGVIAIDPVGLAALLEFTGPIEVPDVAEPLTADNAAQFLLHDQYVAFADNTDRIDTLETLARATFDRLTTGDLPSPEVVGDILGEVVRAGHIHAYGADPDHQELFTEIGLDGGLPEVEGDSFGVVANNAAGNKIDLFLQRSIDYAADWDPATGEVGATATVTLTNTAPSDGLPDHVIGSPLATERRPPPGTNRTYLSVYSPWLLVGATLDGEPVDLERQTEGGRYAYSLFVDIPPGGGSRSLTLELRGLLAPGDDYVLDVMTQPLVRPDQLALVVEVAGEGEISAGGPLVVDGRRAAGAGTLTAEETRYRIGVDP